MACYKEHTRLKDEHTQAITTVAFSPDGSLLATGSVDGLLCIWKWGSSTLTQRFTSKEGVAVLSCTWKPGCNDAIICGLSDGAVAEYSFRAMEGRAKVDGFHAHDYPVEKLVLSKKRLASGAQKEVRIWIETKAGWMLKLQLPDPPTLERGKPILVSGLHWIRDEGAGEVLLVSYIYHGLVFYRASDWGCLRVIEHPGPLVASSVSQDFGRIAAAFPGGGFDIYKLNSSLTAPEFHLHGGRSEKHPLPVLFIHGGRALLTGGYRNDAVMWDVSSNRPHQRFSVASRSRTTCFDAFLKIAEESGVDDEFAIAIGYTVKEGSADVVVFTIKQCGTAASPQSSIVSRLHVHKFTMIRFLVLGILVAIFWWFVLIFPL